MIDRLTEAGGRGGRDGEAPYGGFRDYVADPDDHCWDIAWNASWTIDASGMLTFGP